MPLFGKKKKAEASTEEGDLKDEAPPEGPKKPEKKKATTPPAEKAHPGRRTVPKPNHDGVTQKNTQVLYRLNYAVKQHPNVPSRSGDLIPLNKEFEYMRKQLRSLLNSARKYQKAMGEVVQARSEVGTCSLTANWGSL